MTLFSEKMLIPHRCIRGLMPNLIKKSCTVSNTHIVGGSVNKYTNEYMVPYRNLNFGFTFSEMAALSNNQCKTPNVYLHFINYWKNIEIFFICNQTTKMIRNIIKCET